MKLDRNIIMDLVYKIKNGEASKYELKQALGGEKLHEIFNDFAIEGILETIIENGKFHNLLKAEDGDGLDILEGLLNNMVMGDLSDFYMIKSDYILNLSPEERKNMAESISGSGDQKGLSNVLQILWNQGIGTEACTTRTSDNVQMIKFIIKLNELDKQKTIQQMYQHVGIDVDSILYNFEEQAFEVLLSGDNLYEYIQGKVELSVSTNKDNIFERAMQESLEFLAEMYDAYSKNGQDTTQLKTIISNGKRYIMELKKQNQMTQTDANTGNRIYDKKTWELEPEEEERIKSQSIEIGKKYSEKQSNQGQNEKSGEQKSKFE